MQKSPSCWCWFKCGLGVSGETRFIFPSQGWSYDFGKKKRKRSGFRNILSFIFPSLHFLLLIPNYSWQNPLDYIGKLCLPSTATKAEEDFWCVDTKDKKLDQLNETCNQRLQKTNITAVTCHLLFCRLLFWSPKLNIVVIIFFFMTHKSQEDTTRSSSKHKSSTLKQILINWN